MAKAREYRPAFSDLAAESILAMPKRMQRKVMEGAYRLAAYPWVVSDYRVQDDEGREVEHILVDDFIFTYWVDHAVCLVMITEVEQT